MKVFSLKIEMGQVQKLFIFKIFLVNFFCDTYLTKFLLKVLSDPSCSIYEIYKGKLQSLTKIRFHNGRKKFQFTLIVII